MRNTIEQPKCQCPLFSMLCLCRQSNVGGQIVVLWCTRWVGTQWLCLPSCHPPPSVNSTSLSSGAPLQRCSLYMWFGGRWPNKSPHTHAHAHAYMRILRHTHVPVLGWSTYSTPGPGRGTGHKSSQEPCQEFGSKFTGGGGSSHQHVSSQGTHTRGFRPPPLPPCRENGANTERSRWRPPKST